MTLLPALKFNRGPGRVLYLTGSQLSAFEWRGGKIINAYLFQAGEEGLVDFSRFLQEATDVPVYFLVDVVEEEYRRDTIPHVYGKDHKALVNARTRRLFRETTYTCAILQGREPGGRRDDRILYAALTNPGLLAPWMDRIKQHKVPLGGIYSLPLLSRSLLASQNIDDEQVLLISLQSVGNMRQSYFQDGHLKISRLAHLPARGPKHVAEAIFDEVEKLRRYLNSLRLLERAEPLDVYMLLHGDVYSTVNEQLRDSTTTRFHVLDIVEVAGRLKLGSRFVSSSTDSLFAHLLMRVRPENHYATRTEQSYFTLHRLRFALLLASIVCLIGGLFWSALEVVDGLIYQQRSVATKQQAEYYQQRYRQATANLPELPDGTTASELKRTVEAADTLRDNRTTPVPLMSVLSTALNGYPRIRINHIDWRIDRDPNAMVGGGNQLHSRPGEASGRYEAELDEGFYHLGFLKGQIDPFDGDYRRALQTVRSFVDNLRSLRGVLQVRIMSLPLNVNSNQSLQGDMKVEPQTGKASFSVRMIYRGEHEAI